METKKTLGSDNHAGVHPEMLKSISEVNENHSPSYGTDQLTQKANKEFKKHFGENCSSFFVFNGTAANVLAIQPFVKSFNSVICTDISHLNVDECGAPEKYLGCKLQTVPHTDGKLTAQQIEDCMVRLGDQHYSQPKMVSLTQPTEVGTVYSQQEMLKISKVCEQYRLHLHIDGARFILAAQSLNMSFKEIVDLVKPKSISFGGTKNGLLFGEAVLLFDDVAAKEFKYFRKQAMQLPSKMRFLSAQFIKLLNIWPEIAKHELQMAKHLNDQIKDINEIVVSYPVEANSVFAKIPKAWTKPLKKQNFFYVWDETTWVMRWMCSFNTTKEDIDQFVSKIKELKGL